MCKILSLRLFTFVSAIVLFTACQVPVVLPDQIGQLTTASTSTPEQQLNPTNAPTVTSSKPTVDQTSLAASSSTPPVSIRECAIDVHSHLDKVRARNTETTFLRSAENAIAIMDELGIQKELVMPPPFSNRTGGYEYDLFL